MRDSTSLIHVTQVNQAVTCKSELTCANSISSRYHKICNRPFVGSNPTVGSPLICNPWMPTEPQVFYDFPAQHWAHLRSTNPTKASSPRGFTASARPREMEEPARSRPSAQRDQRSPLHQRDRSGNAQPIGKDRMKRSEMPPPRSRPRHLTGFLFVAIETRVSTPGFNAEVQRSYGK